MSKRTAHRTAHRTVDRAARGRAASRHWPALTAVILALGLALWLPPTTAHAGGLKAYKKQKHRAPNRPRVTVANCPAMYVKRCAAKCAPSDAGCRQRCQAAAGPFCRKRRQRKANKTTELVGKAGSLGIGLIALGVSSIPMSCSGIPKQGEGMLSIPWDTPSFIGTAGGGVIGDTVASLQQADTRIFTATFRARIRFLGLSAMYSRLTEGTESLDELDFGPTFYFANSVVTFGIQPSVLLSVGNGVDPLWGRGMRTWTRIHFGPLYGLLDVMLGKLNAQWNYHARLGAGLRFHPRFFLQVALDYRDILDMNDLDISQRSLGGAVVMLGSRFN